MLERALFGLLLLSAALLPARVVRATEQYPPYVLSASRACRGDCFGAIDESGLQLPGPAVTSIGRLYTGEGYNLSGEAAASLIHGEFSARAYSAGFSVIYPFASNAVSSGGSGQLFDTLIVTGGTGTALFHLPIRVSGGVIVQWSASSNYIPPYPPAQSTFFLSCGVNDPANPAQPVGCDDPEIIWLATTSVDEVVELVWSFTFGAESLIDLRPSVSANFGPTASQAGGQMTGTAAATLVATFEPAYVTDLGGSPIADVFVASESGFDYLTAVPEPDAAMLSAVAKASLLTLCALRRARPSSNDRQSIRRLEA